MAPTPGQIVGGKLRLVRVLASGAMGTVWVAHRALDGTNVAIKFLDPALADEDETMMERFEAEARVAEKLRSPHIAQVLDHGVHQDGPYIVMELLEGQTLSDWLAQRGPMSPHETAVVLGQVADALTRSHEAGVVHRDLKPDNLFQVGGPADIFVKVLDFGVAKHASEPGESLTATHAVVGTPSYMSPEQLASGKNVDHRTDLWALAVVCYELMSGRVPFVAPSFVELYRKVTRGAYEPISALIGDAWSPLDGWFDTALSQERDDRFQSARAMATAFRAALGEVPDGATTLPLGSVVRDQDEPQAAEHVVAPTVFQAPPALLPAGVPRRRPLLPWVVAAVGAALIGLLFLAAGPDSPEPDPPPIERPEIPAEVAAEPPRPFILPTVAGSTTSTTVPPTAPAAPNKPRERVARPTPPPVVAPAPVPPAPAVRPAVCDTDPFVYDERGVLVPRRECM